MLKVSILILGKLPPPYFGPAIATEIILNSELSHKFNLIHVDTKLNKKLDGLGKKSIYKLFITTRIYLDFVIKLFRYRPEIILIPIGQETISFVKDAMFIFLGWMSGSRVLIHLRGSNWQNWQSLSSKLTRWYVSRSLKFTSGAIVLGENLKYLFQPYFPDERIFVVPNGGNYAFPAGNRADTHARVLYFANLLESKGILDVIQSASFLKEMGIVFTTQCVGEFSNESTSHQCYEMVNKNLLPVTFYSASYGSDKLQFFANADIFLFPPRMPEGHPWVIVEALAAGLPIISTNQGAITESVKDGVNGFIVNSSAPDEIAEKLRILIENPGLREQMGLMSRKIYEENFTEQKMVERLTHVFNTLLDKKNDS